MFACAQNKFAAYPENQSDDDDEPHGMKDYLGVRSTPYC